MCANKRASRNECNNLCLGQNDAADLRMRENIDPAHLAAAIDGALARKLKGHDFITIATPGQPCHGLRAGHAAKENPA